MAGTAKAYRCPKCGYTLPTGPYDWMLELEERGGILCPKCKGALMVPVE